MKRIDRKPVDLPRSRRDAVRREVRATYARAAAAATAVASSGKAAACRSHSGLGCGSPVALARLSPGEWVLDLGSGAGFDCLAAAVEVGRGGRVVGVDMTPEMVRLARRHAAESGVGAVSFVQAEIECLPFRDATFDVVISNCVVNLCAERERALAEACRVLKPNGRLAVADVVAVAPLPDAVLADVALHAGCVAGATPLEALSPMLDRAGFESAEIALAAHSGSLIGAWAPGTELDRFVAAVNVSAKKSAPKQRHDEVCHGSA
jgi:SAM-dependent methyltransferase